ncbi:hypothetical protein M378DRAFT_169114, partial [Amanita muscaria Koide BX008]
MTLSSKKRHLAPSFSLHILSPSPPHVHVQEHRVVALRVYLPVPLKRQMKG